MGFQEFLEAELAESFKEADEHMLDLFWAKHHADLKHRKAQLDLEKVQSHVSELQKRNANLQRENQELKNEVQKLRGELTRLKFGSQRSDPVNSVPARLKIEPRIDLDMLERKRTASFFGSPSSAFEVKKNRPAKASKVVSVTSLRTPSLLLGPQGNRVPKQVK